MSDDEVIYRRDKECEARRNDADRPSPHRERDENTAQPQGMYATRDSAGNILRAMAHRGHVVAEEYAALAKLADFADGTPAEAALYNLLAAAAGHTR
jgi:hypothetical protein